MRLTKMRAVHVNISYHIVGKTALVVARMTENSRYNSFLVRQSFFGRLCVPFSGTNFQFFRFVYITEIALNLFKKLVRFIAIFDRIGCVQRLKFKFPHSIYNLYAPPNRSTHLLTQWFPVIIAFGWISEPPHKQASSSIRINATVHGNSPKPASLSWEEKNKIVRNFIVSVRKTESNKYKSLTNAPVIWKSRPPTLRIPHPAARVGLFVGCTGTIGSSRWFTPRQHTSSTSWQSRGSKRMSMRPNPVTALSSAISLTVLLLGSHMWYGTHVHCWLLSVSRVCGAVVGTKVGSGVTTTPKPRFGGVLNTFSMAACISGFAGSNGCCRRWRKCCGTAFIVFIASNKTIVKTVENGCILYRTRCSVYSVAKSAIFVSCFVDTVCLK